MYDLLLKRIMNLTSGPTLADKQELIAPEFSERTLRQIRQDRNCRAHSGKNLQK